MQKWGGNKSQNIFKKWLQLALLIVLHPGQIFSNHFGIITNFVKDSVKVDLELFLSNIFQVISTNLLPGATRMFHFTSINYENAKIDYLVPLKPTKKNFFYYNTTFLSSPKLQSCSQYFGTVWWLSKFSFHHKWKEAWL